MTGVRRILLVLLLVVPWYAMETPFNPLVARVNGPSWAVWLLIATPYAVMLTVAAIWERPRAEHARRK